MIYAALLLKSGLHESLLKSCLQPGTCGRVRGLGALFKAYLDLQSGFCFNSRQLHSVVNQRASFSGRAELYAAYQTEQRESITLGAIMVMDFLSPSPPRFARSFSALPYRTQPEAGPFDGSFTNLAHAACMTRPRLPATPVAEPPAQM